MQEVAGSMKVKVYEVLYRAIESGIDFGWNRAHKHTDTPSEEAFKDAILQNILTEICEVFYFEDKEDDVDDTEDGAEDDTEDGAEEES